MRCQARLPRNSARSGRSAPDARSFRGNRAPRSCPNPPGKPIPNPKSVNFSDPNSVQFSNPIDTHPNPYTPTREATTTPFGQAVPPFQGHSHGSRHLAETRPGAIDIGVEPHLQRDRCPLADLDPLPPPRRSRTRHSPPVRNHQCARVRVSDLRRSWCFLTRGARVPWWRHPGWERRGIHVGTGWRHQRWFRAPARCRPEVGSPGRPRASARSARRRFAALQAAMPVGDWRSPSARFTRVRGQWFRRTVVQQCRREHRRSQLAGVVGPHQPRTAGNPGAGWPRGSRLIPKNQFRC